MTSIQPTTGPVDDTVTARPPDARQLGAVIGGAILVVLPLVDAAVPALERYGQSAALLVALVALRRLIRDALRRRPVLVAVLLTAGLAALGIGTGHRFEALADTTYLVRVGLLVPVWVLVGAAIGRRREDLGFLDGVVIGSIIASVLDLTGRTSIAGHIELGRAQAAGIPLIPYASFLRFGAFPRLNRVVVFGFLVASALATGARGPVLFGIGVLVAVGIVKRSSGPGALVGVRGRRIAVVSLSLLTVWIALGTDLLRFDTDSQQLRRQQELLEARSIDEIPSARIRIEDLWGPAVELIEAHPVGGVGLPASLHLVDAGRRYPHNLVLELGIGFGVTGLLMGVAVVGAIAVLARRLVHTSPMLVSLAVHQLLNSMVSADLGMNRWVFLGLAGLVAQDAYRRRREPTEPVTAVDASA